MPEFSPRFESSPERAISHVVSEVFTECRENIELYDSDKGISFEIAGVAWGVLYRDGQDFNNERVIVYRDPNELNNPMYFTLYAQTSNAVKNEEITKKDNGVAQINRNGEELVEDPAELELIQAIITTAHNIKRSTH